MWHTVVRWWRRINHKKRQCIHSTHLCVPLGWLKKKIEKRVFEYKHTNYAALFVGIVDMIKKFRIESRHNLESTKEYINFKIALQSKSIRIRKVLQSIYNGGDDDE